MLDEFLYLILPAWPQNVFFDALNCYHKSSYIFNQNIITSDEQFLFLLFLLLLLLN